MNLAPNEQSRWPVGAIFGYGTLGSGTPAGRRYHRRSSIALLVLVGWIILASNVRDSTIRMITPIMPGAVFLYIVYEFRRYLLALDELARRMQMEALAWTYLTGLAVAMVVGGLSTTAGWRINPMWFVILEPVRALFLYVASRRY